MKIVYLNHSGFLVEWENCYWLFDYYKGEIPQLDGRKDIFVFCSHSHGDHFNPDIFALKEQYEKVSYIFSNEIRKSCEKMKKKQDAVMRIPEITYVLSRKDYEFQDSTGEKLYVHTLQSTDCGCAFFINYKEKTVYHAGDLHWWYWSGEEESWNKKMTSDYKKEMEYLEGREIDIAFSPLDPRQGEDYALGLNYLLEKAVVKHMIPMHLWDDFTICKKYVSEHELPERSVFHGLEYDGQILEFMV